MSKHYRSDTMASIVSWMEALHMERGPSTRTAYSEHFGDDFRRFGELAEVLRGVEYARTKP